MDQSTVSETQDPLRYRESYRLQYHFSPAKNWMNDPNGLIYHKGVYHMFYQYNPYGDKWGHMSWGHAISKDLVTWKERPIAIPETDGVMIFSGSIVFDENNVSNLGTKANPPLLAYYTGYHEGGLQDQRLAFSVDDGETWSQFRKNPILDLGMTEFRDPQIIWYADTQKWVMAVAMAELKKITFYESFNLIDWKLTGEFGPQGSKDEIWECPNLLPLATPGGEQKWCLLVSVGGRENGFPPGVQYFVGAFNGETFINDGPTDQVLWLDRGLDFYAPQIFNNAPDNRRICIGWFLNWAYGADVPTSPWRGSQTLPRELRLDETAEGLRLHQDAVAEVEFLRGRSWSYGGVTPLQLNEKLLIDGVRGRQMEMVLNVTLSNEDSQFYLAILGTQDGEFAATVSYRQKVVTVVRSSSRNESFSQKFDQMSTMSAMTANPIPTEINLHVFLDWSSVEVFLGLDAPPISARVFPPDSADKISVGGDDRCIIDANIYELQSVFN